MDEFASGRAPGGWAALAQALHDDIVFGRLLPRERLIEDALMERFEASRHAVRRAFEELQLRGLVVREPNRGACVRNYSRDEVTDLFELQSILETEAVRRMTLPPGPQQLKELQECLAAHEKASNGNDPWALSLCNKAFHRALFASCPNASLRDAIHGNSLLLDPIRMRRIPDLKWRATAVQHHRDMVAMVEAGDRKSLLQICEAHLLPTRDFYLQLYVR
jgi:DNA-binding GntR family transcriptional regulator